MGHPIDSALIDKLAPAFTESGSAVTCQPVEGYPLGVVSKIEPIQEGSGDPSPDNIRPITGHSEVKLWRGGKNLLDTKNPKVYHYNSSSRPYNHTLTDTGFRVSANTEVDSTWAKLSYLLGTSTELAGKTITVSCKYNSLVSKAENYPYVGISNTDIEPCRDNSNIIFENGGYIGSAGLYEALVEGNPTSTVKYTVTGNEERKYIILTCMFAFGGSMAVGDWVEYSDIQVEVGSSATTYEPYRGETFTAELGQDVYGGSFNWSTGELVIDRKMITLDGSEGTWISTQSNTAGKNRYYLYNVPWFKDYKFAPGSSTIDPILRCSKLLTKTADRSYMCEDCISTREDLGKKYIFVYCEQYATDLEGFKEMIRGAQIVLGLKEPITVQLTPQEILALLGVNTIYSDTGDTTVTGRADPTAVIEKLTNAIVALGGTV